MRSKPSKPISADQHKRFIEAAREAGASEDEAVFDENLRRVAQHKPKEEREPQK